VTDEDRHRDWTSLPAGEADGLLRCFQMAVLREFAFLDDLGYRLAEVGGPILTWESDRADLSVWMNPQPNLELFNADIALAPAWTRDDPCRRRFDASLDDLAEWTYSDLSYQGLRRYVRLKFPLNHTRPDYEPLLVDSIERLATVLREEFTDLVANRDGNLDRLAVSLAEWHERKTAEDDLASIRPRAQRAFKAGEWQSVIDLYMPLRDFIKGSEQMRIDYARRRLAEEQDE
jgi:hypothetical protein